MPLPTADTPWPPPYLGPALDAMHTWDTWWSGDPDRLETLYGGSTGGAPDPKRLQYAGGVVGRIARWWWGTPTAPGERRTKMHVPIAGDLCGGSADLLFSEPPRFTVDDDTTQKRLDELADDGMLATLQTAAEVGAALGGVYLRPVYDTELADRPWLDAVHADRAVPEFVWGRLAAVTFWRIVREQDGQVWRHLERHEPGVILHGLYQGTRDKLGRPVPLEDSEATEGFALLVNEDGAIETGYQGLDVVYIPNQSSRRWRCKPRLQDLGRSDLDGVEPLMDALDETYSSWMRDIRLGKGRIIVPETYLQSAGPGRGVSWNPDQEAYSGVNVLSRGDSGGMALTVAQFAIRVQEHRDTAEDLVNQILRSAGYSGQTFGIGGDVAVTATEVTARERRSMTTRGRKILRWRPALAHIIEALLAVDQYVYGGALVPQRPNVEFEDSVQEDPLSLANTVDVLRRAQAASTDTLVRMAHPEWDEDQVQVEVQRIQQEQGMAVPDPMQTGALP
ncbi:capsid protein [Streptomyces leeuwenhoekii]|uniref:Capsid protein n=1 Tax=Streptomyces leeuwenhoekii TaxID=1437453 RepID=A0ABR5HT42_STRLW|nr:phage portal protein [Streptomyces leeuwenhoekii]KMS71311.1 capsid protein [Streptomyces leeuwenhoekii]